MSLFEVGIILFGIGVVWFIFAAPFTYDAQAEEEGPK